MGSEGEPSPYEAVDAAGFVAAMQRLKEQSGLTYRELEVKAARSGDVLARSTLADVLRRATLPRPEVVAAFVRACGAERHVDDWLAVRERIAAESAASPDARPEEVPPAAEPGGADEEPARARRLRPVVLAAVVLLPLLALVAWALLPDRSDSEATDSPAPADGWVTIRPSRTPDLCLTDGRDRAGAYDSAVAAQLPCAQVTVPRVYLEPAGEGLYRIQWHHPDMGKGCLIVMTSGPARSMLEPRRNCAQATLFRLTPAGDKDAQGYSLRPTTSGRCVGIAGGDTAVGAEAVVERCTGAADQLFVIRPD